MTDSLSRRAFIAASAATGAALSAGRAASARTINDKPGGGPVSIASANGVRTTELARARMVGGADPLDAIVAGVKIVEDDPDDMTVGYGGLPNEEGVVELDSCVMHGPMHRSGAVASLRNIKNPAAVAREVARRTDHCLIVGDGALKFARRLGFEEENLLTERARKAWLRWRATLNRNDDWLQQDEFDLPADMQGQDVSFDAQGVPHTTGTIHCSAVDGNGDLAGCTTTSGLSWKIPGRVGDSPIIGAGCYTDNSVGSAGATGRGEAVIQVCGAHAVVVRMEAGDTPAEACLNVLKKIVEKTRVDRLRTEDGRPNFDVKLYALRKDGAFGGASIYKGGAYAVADAKGARTEKCAYLYERG